MKRMIKWLCASSWLLFLGSTIAESDSPQTRRDISGPRSVEAQMDHDRSIKDRTLPEIGVLKPWFSWKESLAKKHGV